MADQQEIQTDFVPRDGFDESFDRTAAAIKEGFLWTLTFIFKILVSPLNFLSWLIETIRRKRYNPEKEVCPGCGYRQCTIKFVRTMGEEKAAIQHCCYRCGCDEFYTPLFRKAQGWLPDLPLLTKEEAIRTAAKRGVL